MPSELHRKILDTIPLKTIFNLRCVNKFFNEVMFPNEAWNSFGSGAMSHKPAFYFKSTSSVDWFTFDVSSKQWQRMKRFEGAGSLRHLHRFTKDLINQLVFPAGGLLCILHQSLRQLVDDQESNPVKYAQTLFPFIVWNPLTLKWSELAPNLHNLRRHYTSSDSAFIHAFAHNRGYKILVTLKDYTSTGGEKPMTTELYDSVTGKWKECAPYDGARMRSSYGSGQGVFCNGVVYFQLWRPRSWILFCFDVSKEVWSEEESEQRALRLFEWNGDLMTTLPPLDSWNKYEKSVLLRRCGKEWLEVGIAVPSEVRREFSRGEEIVACQNFLCLSGYDRHGSFKTAVYDQALDRWQLSSSNSPPNLPPVSSDSCFDTRPHSPPCRDSSKPELELSDDDHEPPMATSNPIGSFCHPVTKDSSACHSSMPFSTL